MENLLKEFPNVLTLRVRMPIVESLVYPRNFITKIIKYDRVVDIPNSMTVLPELLPYAIEMVSVDRDLGHLRSVSKLLSSMQASRLPLDHPFPLMQAKRKLTGIMNFTNPGVVSHNEVGTVA